MEKVNVILDTDISNEIDDQFALAYLIKSLKNINLEAITIAPFEKSGYSSVKSIEEGQDVSFNTAEKILDLMNARKYKKKMYKGALKYFFESKESNQAVEEIIKIARKNGETIVIAIGAITNIALAFYHAPDIVSKTQVIWLGGHSFLSNCNNEFNFRQDVEAVKFVFNSKVKLTVIPCHNVASQLSTTIFELKHYLAKSGDIGEYLCDIFDTMCKTYNKEKLEDIGHTKVIWDISAIAYLLNKNWFTCKAISCPKIDKNLAYKHTTLKHKINFVMNLKRDKIYQDFFLKMGNK